MTGGTDRAREVNRDLAQVAERHGLAFGVGSQRAMAEHPELAPHLPGPRRRPARAADRQHRAEAGHRDWAWTACGAWSTASARTALALHLNAAQELSQPEGDRDFRGGYSLVQALVSAFGERFLVKETGCGIAPAVARRLVDCGVRTIDVSGLGGTSWVRVEQLRATGQMAELGALFSSWGIPTAAAVASVRRAVGPSVKLIASGGIRHGLDVAKALAIGADLAGMALPLFRAQQTGGVAGADAAVRTVVAGLRQALLLTSSRTVADLRRSPRVVTAPLKDWMESL